MEKSAEKRKNVPLTGHAAALEAKLKNKTAENRRRRPGVCRLAAGD